MVVVVTAQEDESTIKFVLLYIDIATTKVAGTFTSCYSHSLHTVMTTTAVNYSCHLPQLGTDLIH